jgi:hypothetical protein
MRSIEQRTNRITYESVDAADNDTKIGNALPL